MRGEVDGEEYTEFFCTTHDRPYERLAARDRKKTKPTKTQRRKRQLQTYQRTVKRQAEEISELRGKLGVANQLADSYHGLSTKLNEDVNKFRDQAQDRKKFLEAIAVVFPTTKERIDAFLQPPARVGFHPLRSYHSPEYTLKRLSKLRARIKL